MPIDPGYLPIASLAPDTLKLCLETFAQCTGIVAGLLLATTVAVTWKG